MAIRHDYALLQIYQRIAKTNGGKKAIVAIARRLIGRIRSCFRTKQLYKILKIPSQIDIGISNVNIETGELIE